MLLHFLLLASHYVLRPVRDEIGSAWHGDLSWIWTLTFAATLLGVPLYGRLVSRGSRARFLPRLYLFLASNALLFGLALGGVGDGGHRAIEWTFYAWNGAYVLFAQTSFWAFMADLFRPEDAGRLFGLFGFGGSAGALAGSGIATVLVPLIGRTHLPYIAALLLALAALAARATHRAAARHARGEARVTAERAVPGGALTGIGAVVRSPYVLGIALFLLLLTLTATLLYRVQSELLGELVADRDARAGFLARIDLAVNALSLATLAFATGRLVPRFGAGPVLALLPLVCAVGFAGLALAPALGVVAAVQIARRTSNYALAKPARELLFTVLPRAQRYRAKALLDASVYRGGDLAFSFLFDGLRALGLSVAAIALGAVPIAGAWGLLSLALGRRHRALARTRLRDG